MRIVFLGVVALTVLPWSNAECPSSLSPNVICQPQEDIGVCIRSHLEFGGNGCISIHLSEGTYYLSERFEVVNRSVSITSTELVLIACNFSSTFSRSPVFSVKEAEFAELKGVNFSSCSNTVEFVSVRTVKIIGATFDSFSGSGAVNVFNCDEVFVEDCVFQHSTSTTPVTEDDFRGSSGGLSISSNHPNPPPLSFTIRNTIFRNLTSLISPDKIRNSQDNDAYFRSFQGRGGGVSVILNNSTEMDLLVTNCTFSGNNATLNGGGLYLFVRYLSAGLNMTIFDNSFTNNTVTPSFNASINNGVNNGGGAVGVTLYEGSGQDFTNSIQLSRNVFVGNVASYSGALFIVSATVSAASSVDILVEDSLFTDNHALFSGTAITISAPVRLTLDGNEKMTPGTPRSPILRNIDNTNRRHPDPYNPSWQLSTPVARFEIKCRVESVRNSPARNCDEVRAYPGERVFLDIEAYSELGHRTYGLFSLQVNNSNQDQISVYPPLYSVYPNTRECPFIFSYKHANSLSSFNVIVESNGYSSATTLDLLPVQVIQIEITSCPVGHEISKETGRCVCQLSEQLQLCDSNRLILKDGYWGMSFKNGSSQELLTFKCPPGYCRCYFNFQPNQTFTTSSGCDASSSSPAVSDNSSSSTCDALFDVFAPNDQCSCNRTGYLCGSCRNGYAVTALLSRCRECHNPKSILIIILIILDAAAIIVLCTISVFVQRFHFPSSMYALLFYVQIAPYATDDFPVTYERFYQVVRYLGSLLGLYFPYDACLSGSTTALGAYATRYIPFLVSLVVLPTVIGVMWCFRKKVKMTYNGVWFVWMLILNDLLATSFSILNCPILPDENGTLHSVWYYDGTVKCFVDGGHAVLGIWAIIVLLLVIGAMVMILVVMYPTERLKSAGIFFLSLIIIVNAYFKPYRDFSDNLLQLILLGVFLSLLLLRQTSAINDSLQNSFITDTPTNNDICSEADINLTWFSVILGIWYCLPVLLFAMPLTVAVVKKFSGRCAFLIRKKREIQKKRGTLKSSNRVVTTELSVFEPLIVENQQTSLSEDKEDVEDQAKDKDQHEGELEEKIVSSSGSIVNASITCSDL